MEKECKRMMNRDSWTTVQGLVCDLKTTVFKKKGRTDDVREKREGVGGRSGRQKDLE